ncbi:MAG: VOC family protein [Deinococcales bacterium]
MGRVIHFEIPARDMQRAGRFYREALGWTVTGWEGPVEYLLVGTGSGGTPGIDGGILRANELIGSVVNTASVDDLEAALERVKAAGGTVERGRQAVPGVGYMAYCRDTEGNLFGLMQEDASAV